MHIYLRVVVSSPRWMQTRRQGPAGLLRYSIQQGLLNLCDGLSEVTPPYQECKNTNYTYKTAIFVIRVFCV